MTLEQADETWIDAWLDRVAKGIATMSQRSLAAVEKHGGLGHLVDAARRRGVHLVLLTDDEGVKLVLASLNEFETLC